MQEIIFFAPAGLPIAACFWGVIGLLVGSFLNVVIHRLPVMVSRESDHAVIHYLEDGVEQNRAELIEHQSLIEKLRTTLTPKGKYNIVVPRSACPHCGHSISALENIPIISYLAIRGKCVGCKAPISIRYPLVELITGLLTTFVVWQLGTGLAGLGAIIFTWLLLAMTFIDADTQLLPDNLTLSLLWLGLLINIPDTFVSLDKAVIGAIVGYLSLWSVYHLFKLITGKEGMGYGDFKLLAALGAWMGWQMLPLIILLSSVVGAAVGIFLILTKRLGKGKPIPFGPYLAAAGFIALFWGHSINEQYLQFIR